MTLIFERSQEGRRATSQAPLVRLTRVTFLHNSVVKNRLCCQKYLSYKLSVITLIYRAKTLALILSFIRLALVP